VPIAKGCGRKSAPLGPIVTLLVNSKREWLVSGMVGGQSRRGPIQGLFLSHQSWYLRAPAHPGTMPKARRKESPGFTQRTEASLAGSPRTISATILRVIISAPRDGCFRNDEDGSVLIHWRCLTDLPAVSSFPLHRRVVLKARSMRASDCRCQFDVFV